MDSYLSRPSHTKFFFHFFVLLLMVLLSSCSHVSRPDGPPSFYVDERRIPNAVPKVEPRAKYGNMASYVVFGRRYRTMQSSNHYQAIGIASWYGTKFHSHLTSSGERYNMLAMTAAHKTLPLPTYVQVTNLRNHKQVIVKVNDRGPFESNRLIDLSYVAAKKLGMLGRGTAPVRIRAIDPVLYAASHGNMLGHFASLKRPIPRQRHFASVTRVVVRKTKSKHLAMAKKPRLKRLGLKTNKTYGA
jgi:rare lipoprotein A